MRKLLVIAVLFAVSAGCNKSKSQESQEGSSDTEKPEQPEGAAPQLIDGGVIPTLAMPATKPIVDNWWMDTAAHCPEGTTLKGNPPPEGSSVLCVGEDDKNNGPYTYWSTSGHKGVEGWYVGGEPAGPWTYWYANGQVSRRMVRVPLGGWTGNYEEFDDSGKSIGSYELVGGNGDAKTWNQDGSVDTQGPMVAGLKDGKWEKFDGSDISSQTSYRRGKRHGTQTHWRDGKKSYEGEYADGERHGRHITFDEGKPQNETVYEYGKVLYKFHFQDGELLGTRPTASCRTDDEVSLALEAVGEKPLLADRSCVDRIDSFPGLIMVGKFWIHYGCRPRAVLFDCKIEKEGVDSVAALARVGWQAANADNRKRIAERYVRDVSTNFVGVVDHEPEKLTVTESGGVVKLEAWIRRRSGGRSGGWTTDKKRFTFGEQGAVTIETLKTVIIDPAEAQRIQSRRRKARRRARSRGAKARR